VTRLTLPYIGLHAQTHQWGAVVRAAHSLHRLTHERPARTTNPQRRPSVDKATGARGARRGDGYRVQAEATYPSLALGLVQHRGWQMEKVIHQSPCRSIGATA
jgi:hypothetical protein